MCSLAFFPRILQNDARRAASRLNGLQKVELQKGKVISNYKVVDERYGIYKRKSEPNCSIRCYHNDTCAPNLEYGSAAVPIIVDSQLCLKQTLVEKIKQVWDLLREYVVFSSTSPGADDVISSHELVMPQLLKRKSDISSLGRPCINNPEIHTDKLEAKLIDNQYSFECNSTNSTVDQTCEKKDSVFKDVLAVFPLSLPRKYRRRKYLDKKKDVDYEARIKRMEEMLQTLQKAGYLQEVDRSMIMQEFQILPKTTHSAHILPEIDQTMKAMLDYMKSKNVAMESRNQANKSANTSDDLNVKEALSQVINVNPSDRLAAIENEECKADEAHNLSVQQECNVRDALSQAVSMNPTEKLELECKKPPTCLPPLGPSPQLAPPPKSVPPLPSCKRPKPHKPKSKDT